MRVRFLGLLTICVVVVGVVVGSALARATNSYFGRIEADQNTFIEFKVSGQGKNRKVKELSIVGVARACNNSADDTRMGQLKADQGFRVSRRGNFGGKVKATPIERPGRAATERRWKIRIKGKIGSNKKAAGTVEAHTLPGADHCYTGTLHWTAQTPPPIG